MSDLSKMQSSATTNPPPSSRFRAPAHTVVVVLAALASIATSPARWQVTAPPVPKPAGGKGQLVTIEASSVPHVSVANPSMSRRLRPENDSAAWTGRAQYFVPPSELLKSVEITGTCGGGFCSKCVPPPGAFARVVSAVDVEPWTIDATLPPIKVDMPTPSVYPGYDVVVEATRTPTLMVKLGAPIAGGFYVSESYVTPSPSPSTESQPALKRYRFGMSWYRESNAVGPVSGTWTPIATIAGYCQEAGPCVAPANERVAIVAVEVPPGTVVSSSPPPGPAPAASAGR